VPIILHHHERFAGHGYPYGLRANEIPLGARIVAIADAYDAMINDRPYKRAISHEQAISDASQARGTHVRSRARRALL
jgi:HD-GYP domain-containing protein (c-di-GMP phosphodiesterase class II)